MKTVAKFILLGLLAAPLSGRAPERPFMQKPLLQKQVRYIMGTACAIEVYSDRDSAPAINAAFTELHRIDALLSNWNPDSDLMKLNRAAAVSGVERPWISVSPELFTRIQIALHMARVTEGRFDPTVGPLVRAYGFLPAKSQGINDSIATARARVGWNRVKLDPEHSVIQFAVPGMEIDLGGIAKGYAADRAANVLRQQGITSGLVSLGGSSVTAIGAPVGATGWRLSIRDPRNGSTSAATVELRDGESLATSGTYENTRGRGKFRHSHIIDPQTGRALSGSTGVTVIYSDAEMADALTKPFLLARRPSAENWTKWLAGFENASVILLQVQKGELRRITGGVHPERFGPAPRLPNGHAAEANRRSAQHLARDGEGGAGNSALSSQARGTEAHGPAGYHLANVPGNPGTSFH
jgi:thiamine biosynthesis lipoprotein